jgi:hypothetical protein
MRTCVASSTLIAIAMTFPAATRTTDILAGAAAQRAQHFAERDHAPEFSGRARSATARDTDIACGPAHRAGRLQRPPGSVQIQTSVYQGHGERRFARAHRARQPSSRRDADKRTLGVVFRRMPHASDV